MRDYVELVNELHESADWADRLAVLMGRDEGDSKSPLMRNAADAIEELLARKTAFWVDTQPHMDDSNYKKDGMSYYCSNCHHRAGKYKHRTYRFCPWCGARIVPKEMVVLNEI